MDQSRMGGKWISQTALPARSRGCRRGTLILELVLVLPIVLIGLLAAVQFGKYSANMQELALAARIGGLAASRTAGISNVPGDPVPTNVVDAINQHLASVGICGATVVLEHNLSGGPVLLVSPTSASVSVGVISSPPPDRYVRVIVIVPQAAVMPDILRACGLHLVLPGHITAFSNVQHYAL